jgi:hypothetical protein
VWRTWSNMVDQEAIEATCVSFTTSAGVRAPPKASGSFS